MSSPHFDKFSSLSPNDSPPMFYWRDTAVHGFESQHKLEQWRSENPGLLHPSELLSRLGIYPDPLDEDLEWQEIDEVEEMLTGISTPSDVSFDQVKRIKALLRIKDKNPSKAYGSSASSSTETETDYDYEGAGLTADLLFKSAKDLDSKSDGKSDSKSDNTAEEEEVANELLGSDDSYSSFVSELEVNDAEYKNSNLKRKRDESDGEEFAEKRKKI